MKLGCGQGDEQQHDRSGQRNVLRMPAEGALRLRDEVAQQERKTDEDGSRDEGHSDQRPRIDLLARFAP